MSIDEVKNLTLYQVSLIMQAAKNEKPEEEELTEEGVYAWAFGTYMSLGKTQKEAADFANESVRIFKIEKEKEEEEKRKAEEAKKKEKKKKR